MKFTYRVGAQEVSIVLEKHGVGYRAFIGEQQFAVELLSAAQGTLRFRLDEHTITAYAALDGPQTRWVSVDGYSVQLEKAGTARRRGGERGAGDGLVTAPMPGQVREVLAANGDIVEPGQTLLIMEAMKMEIRIQSPSAGVVQGLSLVVGGSVNKDDVLLKIEKSE